MSMRCVSVSLALILLAASHPMVVAAETEAEAPESAVSSPPMEMDDPGTPGRRGLEVNLVGTLVRVGTGRESVSLLDANLGIGDRLQLKYERPYLTEGVLGAHAQKGLGATELGVKWRFVDNGALAVAFYPQYQFDDAFTLKDEDGVPETSEGRSVYFPILIEKPVGRLHTVAANVGYRRNLEGRGDDLNLALGAGRGVGRQARVLAELFSERDERLRNRQTDVRVGYVFPLFASSRFELPAYAAVGHSLGKTEVHELSTSIVFGISLIRTPDEN